MALEVSEQLWEQAFQLAYFVLMDRSQARECVARALEKLAAQQSREKRRSYWRARKKELTIRRISRPPEDILQWLIYLEAEACEKEQESRGLPTEADMVVRYVKYLAQLTTVNSSFHVNVGFNRLLRNYTTPEVQQVYELATSRYPAADEYRKAKGKLLNHLVRRFARFLKTRTAQYGELQFETHGACASWAGLVENCLEIFAPWSARPSCIGNAQAKAVAAEGHAGYSGGSSRPSDRLETSRCHWFMHSTCYARLVEQLGLDPPGERLSVPRFLHEDDGDPGSSATSVARRTTPLSDEETGMLRARIAAVAAYRHDPATGPLKIVAHGTVCARLDPERGESCSFVVPEATQLLEVWSDAALESRIVATHWIGYDDSGAFVTGEYTIALQGGRGLELRIAPTSHANDQGLRYASVTIESHVPQPIMWALGANPLRPVLASLVCVALGVVASSAYFESRISQDRATIKRMESEVTAQQKAITAPEPARPTAASRPITRYAFSADTLNLRGPGAGEPVVTLPPDEPLAVLELPVHSGERAVYRVTLSTFPQEQERLSEATLRPLRRGDRWIVEFALPTSQVEDDRHYLLTLTSTTGADTARYLFEVRKNSAISTH
jgi:hypothetical protein